MEDAPSTSHPGDELLRAVRFVSDLGRILGERFRASDALGGPAPR